jgi:hypothetical protein
MTVLRQFCIRVRTIHTSTRFFAPVAKRPPTSNQTPPTSTTSPFPPRARPPENDPTYIHPPSSVKAGSAIRGVQILKDKPEVVALPDDYYPDWLWQLLDDPKSVEERQAAKEEVEKKKEIYLRQERDRQLQQRLKESEKRRIVPPGVKRTEEEKKAVRRDAQNEAWIANREKDYDVPQYEMPPERSSKYHKKINKEHIKQDNYLRERRMK